VHFELRWITRIELESELRRWIRFSCFSFRLLNNFDRRWYFYDTSTYDSVKVDGIGYRVSVIGINELVIGLLDRLDFVGLRWIHNHGIVIFEFVTAGRASPGVLSFAIALHPTLTCRDFDLMPMWH